MKYWAIAIVLLVGGPIVAFSIHVDSKNIAAVTDHGKAAKAHIEKVEWTTKHNIDQDYVLLVNSKTEGGAVVTSKLGVDSDTGQKARDHSGFTDIDVLYLPENTGVVYPAGVKQPPNVGYWLAALMSLIGGRSLGDCVERVRGDVIGEPR